MLKAGVVGLSLREFLLGHLQGEAQDLLAHLLARRQCLLRDWILLLLLLVGILRVDALVEGHHVFLHGRYGRGLTSPDSLTTWLYQATSCC